MAPPKIKTLQARFGFADTDLKKPLHDEIIKWLDANIQDILMMLFSLQSRPKDAPTKWEPLVRMNEDGGQFIGFVDLMARFNPAPNVKGVWVDHSHVLFEAKTSIESLGELFRQLRMYQAGYLSGYPVSQMPFVVVCPDETNAEIIREQEFRFLKYDPGMPFPAGAV